MLSGPLSQPKSEEEDALFCGEDRYGIPEMNCSPLFAVGRDSLLTSKREQAVTSERFGMLFLRYLGYDSLFLDPPFLLEVFVCLNSSTLQISTTAQGDCSESSQSLPC